MSKRLRTATLIAAFLIASCPKLAASQTDVGLTPPKLSRSAEPSYPATENARTTPTSVEVELTIDREGKVTDAKVVRSGGGAFDRSALEAARELVFEPARRNGTAIAAVIAFTFRFEPPPPPPAPAAAPPASETPPPAAPEKPSDTGPPSEPLELEVIGERPPRETTVRVLEREEIRTVPGTGGDALRAVETMPGVGRPPGFTPDIVVRGSAPQDTQVFVDGTWLPAAYHFGGVRTVLPAEVIERLNFYPGNFGPQFGRGMGGVIDVGVRSPRSDRVGGLVQVDLLDGRLLVEGPIDDKTRFLVAGRRSWVDAWIAPVLRSSGNGVRTAPVYYDYQAMIERDLSSKTKARLLWFGSDDRLALVFQSPSAGDPVGGNFAAHSGFQRLQLRVDSRLENGGRFTTMGSWGLQNESFSLGDDFVDASYHLANVRSELRYPFSKHAVGIFGVDAFWASYDVTLNLKPFPASDEIAGPYFGRPSRRIHGGGDVFRPGAYAALELRPLAEGAGLLLLPSIRGDYAEDTARASVDPRFGMRWDVTRGFPRTTIKSAIGVFHQPPQPVESVKPFGTPGIRESMAVHASTGFEQELYRGVELSVEAYAKRFEDLVIARPDENNTAIGARFKNSGSGRAFGAETWLRAKVGRFNGGLAYSLSRSERRNSRLEPMLLAAWDQTHVLSTVGSFDLGAGWTTGARFRYVTGTPLTPYVGGVVDYDAGAYAPVPGARYSDRLPAFYQLDLRIEKTWRLGAHARIGAYLDLQNATNRKNPEGMSYRYDYARREPAAGLPILPVIGLRGEL